MAPVVSARLVLTAAAAVWQARADAPFYEGSPYVRELQASRFDAAVLSDKAAWIVDFYADWCPHCKSFAPFYEKAARSFAGDSRVNFGAVDCANEMDFCAEVKVTAYPDLRVYNLPGQVASTTHSGVPLHEGEWDPINQTLLMQFINEKLLLKGPAPVIAPGSDNAKPILGGPAVSTTKDEPASPASAELRLIDAEIALVYSLRQGTAVAAANQNPPPDPLDPLALGGDALNELVLWLEFCAKALPSAPAQRDLTALAGVAKAAQLGSGVLPRSAWIAALDKQPVDLVTPAAGKDPSRFWRLCGGYTCGLWTLFHMLTVSKAVETQGRRLTAFSAEAAIRGLQTPAKSAPVPAPEALERIRGFVGHFFGCASCVAHFSYAYDTCMLGRCSLAATDHQGGAMWLWQAHNVATMHIAQGKGQTPPGDWPRNHFCDACWEDVSPKDNDTWNPPVVWDYLERAYYPAEVSSYNFFSKVSNQLGGWGVPVALGILALVVAALVFISTRRVRNAPLSKDYGGVLE